MAKFQIMATIQAAQNQKETNTGNLIMLVVNIDTLDWLFINQTANGRDIEFAQSSVQKV